MKKEIFWGVLWGLTLGLLITALLFSTARSAAPQGDDAELEISITGDSVQVTIDTGGATKTVVVEADSVTRTASGLQVKDQLLIEDGKIVIDGVELSERELSRLSVDRQYEETSSWRDSDEKRQVKRKRLATVYKDRGGDMVSFGDIVIDTLTVIHGDVVAVSGDVTVGGTVYGDIVSVFGDVYLRGGANIQGDVSAPFGIVHRDPQVKVRGGVAGRHDYRQKKHKAGLALSARFNRVEGFTFLPDFKFSDRKGRIPSVEVNLAYAVTLKRWEYDFGIRHRIGKKMGPFFDIHMLQQAWSSDYWAFTELENTIAGLLFKEDYLDYYWRRGFSGTLGFFHKRGLDASVSYTAVKISNLERTAEKAIFGGNKKFRENWSTLLPDSADLQKVTGDLRELSMSSSYDTRDNKTSPHSGILTDIQWSQSVDSDPADFDYGVITAEAKGYIPLASDQTVMIRALGGYSDDYLPLFRRFFIGGGGSLRGYDYKEYSGNRYILVNTDYVWQFYRSELGAGVFLDAGKAGYSGGEFRRNDLKTDVGVSLLVSDAFRLDLAQRLDDLDKSPVAFGRLQFLF